jgi:hypothetical protein
MAVQAERHVPSSRARSSNAKLKSSVSAIHFDVDGILEKAFEISDKTEHHSILHEKTWFGA